MANNAEQSATVGAGASSVKNKRNVGKIAGIAGIALLIVVLFLFLVNALLCVCIEDYYTPFGRYRLFNITTDAMEPYITGGSIIACTEPTDPAEITSGDVGRRNGTVIVFRVRMGSDSELIVRRVIDVETDNRGETVYVVAGDHEEEADVFRPKFGDIAGVYGGSRVGGLGYIFAFFQSGAGITVLIFLILMIVGAGVTIGFVRRIKEHRELSVAALKKSAQALSGVSLRYDNINEITAVMDVLDTITSNPKTAEEKKQCFDRLNAFVKAENIKLPQTPETVAVLDSLPAPDTPGSLAAALAAGATLRQSEDGQTLVLTTISGGKNILLTPVQTADGIILCRQGSRVISDVAPNIEEVGLMSMPLSPEFFEGQPLEKSVEYPELPPAQGKFGPEYLSAYSAPAKSKPSEPAPTLSAPTPVGQAKLAPAAQPRLRSLPEIGAGSHAPEQTDSFNTPKIEEIPVAPSEAAREDKPVANKKPARQRNPLTPEQKQKAREAAARRRAEKAKQTDDSDKK